MGLSDTVKRMRELLAAISIDIEKAANGNKAASQRVRTGSIRLEKVAKVYRKESIAAERNGNWPKKSKKAQAKSTSSKQQKNKAPNKKTAKHATKPVAKAANKSKQAKVKARPKAKALNNPQRRNVMMKRPTAKIPFKKA